MLNKLKDAALSKAFRALVNAKIGEYGEMVKLTVDSKRKRIEAEVMLEGEQAPIDVTVQRYELFEKAGKYFLSVEGVRTSRAWIDTLAASFLEGRTFEIPPAYARMLKSVI